MRRVAIFVDAAYLFHAGGFALTGSRQERSDLLLDVTNIISELKFVAGVCAPEASFLRIYWYDLIQPGARLTSDQALLANADDVKIRLSSAPALGPFKSLASSIAADISELARNKVLANAVLVSNDEDLRIPIQLSQSFGVRVHLVGMATGRSQQSSALSQEADTQLEWPRDTIQRFLIIRRSGVLDSPPTSPFNFADAPPLDQRLEQAARDFADALDDNDLDVLEAYWASSRGVPSELDRRLLPFARNALGRDLDHTEKRLVRSWFQKQVMDRFVQDGEEEIET